jgi:Condensation domain/TubC N-terminal docking domain
MSTPAEYVMFLNRTGVRLWVDNGQLRYHAKKGVLSPEELARLRSMRNEILAELTKAGASATDSSIDARAENPTEAPVSFQQRWCLKLIEDYPSWKTTLSYTFRLKGPLDCTALEKSLQGILQMHASLRARVVWVRGEWRQQSRCGDGFALPIMQASGELDADAEQSAMLLIRNIEAQELDPAVGPLMRALLIRVSAQEHFLVLLIHRLASDCLGIGQALRDLWALYIDTVPTTSPSSASMEQSTRYRDYALGQHAADEAWRQKHAAHWNEYLAGAECITWPENEDAPAASLGVPRDLVSLESSFGEALSAGLRELSQNTRTLPALILLSLYVACLSRWCGQKDLVVPFIIAGRAAAHEGVVGCFSHIVYLRIRLAGSEDFIELLKLVSNEFYRAAAFRQDSGRMVTERPDLLRGTLCQWLSWHPAEIAGLQTDGQMSPLGLRVEKMRCQNPEELTNAPPERVDLEMSFFDSAGDISALAICRTRRFAEGTLHRLMRELQSVAEHAVRDSRALIANAWKDRVHRPSSLA